MVLQNIKSFFSLRRSKKAFKRLFRLYRQKEESLDRGAAQQLESLLAKFQTAFWKRDAARAAQVVAELQEAALRWMPRTKWDRTRDSVVGIAVALLIAVAVRQSWFEFYSIPTGSMRPTLKEGDYLVVSKTDFGINTLLRSGHLYFDPTLVKRGSVVVFNGEGMDMPNDDTLYFWVIPGKKQYVKRLIGKPGDILYFYGGQIYGVNARGDELKELREAPEFQSLEHIPFIRMEGKVEPLTSQQGRCTSVILSQMSQPVAKLFETATGHIRGELLPPKGKPAVSSYGDLWGFKNYAMSRLLTAEQAEELHPRALQDTGKGDLYLELHHHPSLHSGRMLRDEAGRVRPALGHSISLLPLASEHLARLMQHMTTCRFEVKEGRGYRLGWPEVKEMAPRITLPDGTYEMQNGKAFRILWSGFERELPSTHPIYSADPIHVQTLYNFGYEWQLYYKPSPQTLLPSRYAYFRQGDLYLMNGPILKKGDPHLTLFLKREYQKQTISTSIKPYLPFDDAGPPLAQSGALDVEFIKKFGLTVPDKMYLVLGDNHAMSADSRYFGFVPQNNLRGGAGPLFWPPGARWGYLPQPASSKTTLPYVVVSLCAATIAALCYAYSERKYMRPFAKEGQFTNVEG